MSRITESVGLENALQNHIFRWDLERALVCKGKEILTMFCAEGLGLWRGSTFYVSFLLIVSIFIDYILNILYGNLEFGIGASLYTSNHNKYKIFVVARELLSVASHFP